MWLTAWDRNGGCVGPPIPHTCNDEVLIPWDWPHSPRLSDTAMTGRSAPWTRSTHRWYVYAHDIAFVCVVLHWHWADRLISSPVSVYVCVFRGEGRSLYMYMCLFVRCVLSAVLCVLPCASGYATVSKLSKLTFDLTRWAHELLCLCVVLWLVPA